MTSPLSTADSLDTVLFCCHWHRLSLDPASGDIAVGAFLFSIYPHSTGNSVKGWIRTPTGLYEFMDGTYWFSSRYTFNTFKQESGAWDEALNTAIQSLRSLVKAHDEAVSQCERLAARQRTQEAQRLKQEVESQFMTIAPLDNGQETE